MDKPLKQALFQLVAERLIEQLEKGTSPFHQPWKNDPSSFMLPYNPTTQKNYKGINSIWLLTQPYEDARWLTFKQAQENGWSVKRGEKGTLINYFKGSVEKTVKDESGKIIMDEQGNIKKSTVILQNPIITSAWVFNAAQIKGIPIPDIQEQQWTNIERAELILKASNARIEHGGNEAFYSPFTDQITLPKKAQFNNAGSYYATALHELGHWTGHKSRLDRPILNHFGSVNYAREELRAEISSLMIGAQLNIGHDFGQHAAYVSDWITILKKDPFEIHRAAADAQRITDYIMNLELKRQKKIENPGSLMVNDEITYKGQTFRVASLMRNKRLMLENLNTGERIKLSPNDQLYSSLVNSLLKPEPTKEHKQNLSPKEVEENKYKNYPKR